MRLRILIGTAILLGVAGVVAYFALHGRQSIEQEQKETHAREVLAFASLIDRLPKGKPISPSRPLDSDAKKRWEIVERNVSQVQGQRAELLKALHEKTRKFFVESPGAGPERRLMSPEEILMDDGRGSEKTDQPGEAADFPLSAGETLTHIEPNNEFHFYHDGGLEFLNPAGFGYVKDRGHVAGFKPHGYRSGVSVHESLSWRVRHVQLVGILSHEEPVVYLTDRLPSMEQVRQGKTRSLDFFEEAALPSLREGQDLYIVRKGETIRMLGAMRATKTCQQCHDAQIGDLLGALSYTLRAAPGISEGAKR